ncbi:hypothetical protein PHISP_02416 [Aspergillus sp. HF37]|nr:hypothetical protein PHISP_02416 [Aspergillus sp. HF37]
MEFDVSLDTEQQFWDEIQGILTTPCGSEDLIDNALRSYLGLSTKYKDDYLCTELAISRCLFKLFASKIFGAHADYVRRQIIYGLLQEDDPKTLQLIASFLLFDGRQNEATLQMMNEVGAFPRLLELLQRTPRREGRGGDGAGLHRLLMDILYEMSRIQRVKVEDLVLVDDDFVKGLFELVEDLSCDASDPYHYSVIRVLLVLNEQFMISAHDPVDERSPANLLTNKIIKILSMHGNAYKTFGENIILLINREAETSLQLLTLKLLYLIFTTPSTYEYFYTNDLHVLVDILVRNLLDLPEEAAALRHTYLRVLYPLLAHTQLKYPPHYKRDEVMRMLNVLVRGQFCDTEPDYEKILHFEEVDETTRRLVLRCATVDWLRAAETAVVATDLSAEDGIPLSQPGPEPAPITAQVTESPLEMPKSIFTTTEISSPETMSPVRVDERAALGADAGHHAERLGMHLDPSSSSSLSVQEVASQHEKPGIITPSRADTTTTTTTTTTAEGLLPQSLRKQKVKPEPPKTRRWRGRRPTLEESAVRTTEAAEQQQQQHLLTPRSSIDRRNSAGASSLAPPVPGPAEQRALRSASNPPPAVPPPRRSAQHHHYHQQQLHIQQQGDGATPTTPVFGTTRQAQKPDPPKTRRWGRRKHTLSESREHAVSGEGHHHDDNNGPATTTATATATVTVEEAVQNVSHRDQ